MVKRCCICRASTNDGVTLFSFPKDAECRKKWQEFAGVGENDISSISRICHRHFEDDQITVRKHKRNHLPKAIPTLKFDDEVEVEKSMIKSRYCLQCKTREKRIHFKFPENLNQRNEWLKKCGYDANFFNGDKYWYLCSIHFASNVINKKTLFAPNTHLHSNAMPTLFMAETNNESSPTTEETASNETAAASDYSLFPTKILPDMNCDIVVMTPSSSFTSETSSCTLDNTSLTSNKITNVTPLSETCSDLSAVESSTERDYELITSTHNIDSVHEIQFSTPNVEPTSPTHNIDSVREIQLITPKIEPSVERDTTANEELTPSTRHINSIHDYNTSPSTISKVLALHSNSDCEECAAFKRHIHNSLNTSSQPQITPVLSKAAKRRLCYPGDISTSDYASPKRARQSVLFLQNEIQKYRKNYHVIQQQNRRLKNRIEKYKDLIAHLKEKDLLSKNACAAWP